MSSKFQLSELQALFCQLQSSSQRAVREGVVIARDVYGFDLGGITLDHADCDIKQRAVELSFDVLDLINSYKRYDHPIITALYFARACRDYQQMSHLMEALEVDLPDWMTRPKLLELVEKFLTEHEECARHEEERIES